MGKKKKKNISALILNIVLGILILIGILVFFTVIPFKGNYKLYSVMSGSMAPTIKTGAMVIVVPRQSYKKDDIITYQSGTRKLDITTHRIIEVKTENNRTEFVTKGDANKSSDYTRIQKEKVIGKVVGKINYLGYILGYIKTLPGLLIIIIIPATIIIYEEFKKMRQETIRMVREKWKNKVKESSDK